jgi:hypothetical protein
MQQEEVSGGHGVGRTQNVSGRADEAQKDGAESKRNVP